MCCCTMCCGWFADTISTNCSSKPSNWLTYNNSVFAVVSCDNHFDWGRLQKRLSCRGASIIYFLRASMKSVHWFMRYVANTTDKQTYVRFVSVQRMRLAQCTFLGQTVSFVGSFSCSWQLQLTKPQKRRLNLTLLCSPRYPRIHLHQQAN